MNRVDPNLPDRTVSARDVFNIDTDLQVPAFSVVDEQVAARLNWPRVRAGVRRVRCRPRRRDVCHPARARSGRAAHAARPEPCHRAASGIPPVCHGEHHRTGRCHGALPRHAAAQPGTDGPLEHRGHAERPVAGPGDERRAVAPWLRRRRPVDGDVAACGCHVGREPDAVPRYRARAASTTNSTRGISPPSRWRPPSTPRSCRPGSMAGRRVSGPRPAIPRSPAASMPSSTSSSRAPTYRGATRGWRLACSCATRC